jgi:hypothetical protein
MALTLRLVPIILGKIELGLKPRRAAMVCGISKSAWHATLQRAKSDPKAPRWLQDLPDQIEQAESRFIEKLQGCVDRDCALPGGGALALKLLMARTSEDYSTPKQTVELSGPDGSPIASTVGFSPVVVLDKEGRRVIHGADGRRIGIADADVPPALPPGVTGCVALPDVETIAEPTDTQLARDRQRVERATLPEPTTDDVLKLADLPKQAPEAPSPSPRPPAPTKAAPEPAPEPLTFGPPSPGGMAGVIAASRARDGVGRRDSGGAGW